MLPSPSTTPVHQVTPPAQKRPRKPRGRGLRTTTGCQICRQRHMKCDEIKPICGPCSKGNRPCYYQNPGSKNKTGSTTSSDADVAAHKRASSRHSSWPSSVTESDAGPPSILPPAAVREQANGIACKGSGIVHVRWDATSQQPEAVQPLTQPPHSLETSQIIWGPSQDDQVTCSPRSTLSSFPSETAPLRWFGLLTDDADDFSPVSFMNDHALTPTSPSQSDLPFSRVNGLPTSGFNDGISNGNFVIPRSVSIPSPGSVGPYGNECQRWQSPIQLKEHEIPIFRHFVTNLSLWMDLFDPLSHFSTYVPQLAMNNEGLMKAILALSARHLSIKPDDTTAFPLDRTMAVQYYYETLQYLQKAMKYESYTRSQELIATALTVSTYEMIDCASSGAWERHLEGVFWIQRSQDISGETGGLKQAIWWAWLRQDVWAAFRERRKVFTNFKLTKPYHALGQYDIASRSVYLLSQAVNYASEEEIKAGETNLESRIAQAEMLFNMLDEWRMNLTVHFQPLPFVPAESSGAFTPVWIHPPAFGAAIQMHCFARILLLVFQPARGGFRECLNREKQLAEAIDTIGGIALMQSDDASTVVSTQCLYAAGLYVQDPAKRETILKLIGDHQQRTGWPIIDLGEELQREWAKGDPS